jgi:hypothetical protein
MVDPLEVVLRVVAADVVGGDRSAVAGVLRDVTVLRGWVAAVEIRCHRRLQELAATEPGVDPDGEHAAATKQSPRDSNRARRRERVGRDAPEFERRLHAGELSGEHLDVFAAAVASLPAGLRPRLRARAAALAARAVSLTVEEFREVVRREVAAIEADDGVSRLERQRRETRCRLWTDRDTGMVQLSGRFDPEIGMRLGGCQMLCVRGSGVVPERRTLCLWPRLSLSAWSVVGSRRRSLTR